MSKEGEYIGTAKIIDGSNSFCTSYLEHDSFGRRLEAEEDTRFDSPVRITVISYRQRLADTDGISAKAAIDGLVRCGILIDDSARNVKEVIYRQVKVKSKEEEQTKLVIEEIR